jgi:DNA-binding helix-hairpin-helix protein with protein kinase domain
VEARELKNLLHIEKNDVPALMYALRNTSWSLYQEEKQIEESPTVGVYRVTKCRVQETRINKKFDVFPCKGVRFSYLKAFVEEFNPSIKVNCRFAPPEARPKNVWCEWEFNP